MSPLLIWLIPPIVGAIIGYITNAVAIKMLFRPLEEVRIFGIRLPFTPGILPRQRHRLAENIGAIVEGQLLTPEILITRLQQEDVRNSLKNTIAGYTEKLLNRRSRTLREILGTEASLEIEKNFVRFLEGRIRNSPGTSSFLKKAAEDSFPRGAESFITFLKKPETHRVMEIHGRVFLGNAIMKLNTFQRLFLSAGQFEKTLHERMPEIIDDLIRQLNEILKDRDIQGGIISFLVETVEQKLAAKESSEYGGRFLMGMTASFFSTPLGELLQSLFPAGDTQKKDLFDSFIRDRLLTLAEEQSASLLRTINIKALVSVRIDSLDMLSVEHIVLDVMANQLKWINIFGAILGSLIGLFQSVLSWFI